MIDLALKLFCDSNLRMLYKMKLFCTTPWKYSLYQKQMTGFSFQTDLSLANKMHMLKNELLWDRNKRNTYSYKKFHMYASKRRSLSSSCCSILVRASTSCETFVEEPWWVEKNKEKQKNNFYILNLNRQSNAQIKTTTINWQKSLYILGIYSLLKPS